MAEWVNGKSCSNYPQVGKLLNASITKIYSESLSSYYIRSAQCNTFAATTRIDVCRFPSHRVVLTTTSTQLVARTLCREDNWVVDDRPGNLSQNKN